VPDKVYIPFVENCDFIKPLLEEIYNEGMYREDIAGILDLYSPYQKAVEHINRTYFAEDKPQLSEREEETARPGLGRVFKQANWRKTVHLRKHSQKTSERCL